MFVLDIVYFAFLLTQLFAQTFTVKEIDVKKEAFDITETNCDLLRNDEQAFPIMFAAADIVVIAETNSVRKIHGYTNNKYEIGITPLCILRGDTKEKSLTVQNMGEGSCGITDVEKNGLQPYLFFLRATLNSKVFKVLNLGVKKITKASVIWHPTFMMLCGILNKKVCTGRMCAQVCGFLPSLPGRCIAYEQNVIDEIEKEKARQLNMTTASVPNDFTSSIDDLIEENVNNFTSSISRKGEIRNPKCTGPILEHVLRPREKPAMNKTITVIAASNPASLTSNISLTCFLFEALVLTVNWLI